MYDLLVSYHGYLPIAKQHLQELKHPPSLLEVGVDRGVTFLTLVTFLVRTRPEFLALGVDVLVQEQVQIMLDHLDRSPKQQAYLLQENSLVALPKLVEQGMKFDVLLLDGDHNYHTVSRELQHLGALTHPHSVVVIDDVFGRWSERDLFYSERPGYESCAHATPKTDTEKHGVKAALDEWLSSNPGWKLSQPVPGEAVLLTRQA